MFKRVLDFFKLCICACFGADTYADDVSFLRNSPTVMTETKETHQQAIKRIMERIIITSSFIDLRPDSAMHKMFTKDQIEAYIKKHPDENFITCDQDIVDLGIEFGHFDYEEFENSEEYKLKKELSDKKTEIIKKKKPERFI